MTRFHATHQWSDGPIVTLQDAWEEGPDIVWNEPSSIKTFPASIHNSLAIKVAFRYRKPYGTSAEFDIKIGRPVPGNGHINYFLEDPIYIDTEAGDEDWYSFERTYLVQTFVLGKTPVRESLVLNLSVRAGRDSGWSNQSRSLVAVYSPPKATLIAAYKRLFPTP